MLSPPDGTRVATAGRDRLVKIWESATGRELLSFGGHAGAIWGLAWSPDGTRITTAGEDGTARIWSVEPGREVLMAPTGGSTYVAWSPDGTRLATADGVSPTQVLDAGTGAVVLTLDEGSDYAGGVSWSPDSTRLATSSGNHTSWCGMRAPGASC